MYLFNCLFIISKGTRGGPNVNVGKRTISGQGVASQGIPLAVGRTVMDRSYFANEVFYYYFFLFIEIKTFFFSFVHFLFNIKIKLFFLFFSF